MKISFERWTGYLSILAALSALAYAYYFIIAKDVTLSSLFLMLTGLFGLKVVVGLFVRLKSVDFGFALVALILGVGGALGTAIHGGYDLANAINPVVSNPNLPNQVDPRGLLTFGLTGLAVLKFSWLMSKDKYFPANLSMLGYLSAVLLIVIYLARLIVLSPANPILKYPVLVEGFLINPLWYLWLGIIWSKKK